MSSPRPATSLPIVHYSLSLHHSEHDDSWSANWSIYRQRSDDDMERLDSASTWFGPFDTREDVVRWAGEHLGAALRPPA